MPHERCMSRGDLSASELTLKIPYSISAIHPQSSRHSGFSSRHQHVLTIYLNCFASCEGLVSFLLIRCRHFMSLKISYWTSELGGVPLVQGNPSNKLTTLPLQYKIRTSRKLSTFSNSNVRSYIRTSSHHPCSSNIPEVRLTFPWLKAPFARSELQYRALHHDLNLIFVFSLPRIFQTITKSYQNTSSWSSRNVKSLSNRLQTTHPQHLHHPQSQSGPSSNPSKIYIKISPRSPLLVSSRISDSTNLLSRHRRC